MTLSRALLLTLTALPAMAIAADSVQLKPGRWIETATPESIMVGGKAQPLAPEDTKTKTLCLTDAEGTDPRLYFATAEDNALCTAPSGSVAGGKIDLGNTCRADAASQQEERVLKIDGSYGPERYLVKASMKTHAGPNDVEIRIDVAGRFDGACKGDEDPRAGTPQ